MDQLRIGIIGFGKWVRNAYLPAIRRDGRAKVVSVSAPSESTRSRILGDLGQEVTVFGEFEKLLDGPKLDAVMIAVPDYLHERTLRAVLDSGLPVFYEPPVASRRENIRPMLKRLLDAPQITHADIELCYVPVVSRAAELLAENALGTMQTANIRLQSSWGPKPGFEISNINHMSTWYVDIFNSILGKSPQRVMMFDGHGVEGYRQSHSAAYYDYGGVWGHVKANIASLDKLDLKVEFNGDDGDMLIDIVSGELKLRTRGNPEWVSEIHSASRPYADFPGMNESIAAFIDAVLSGVPSHASAEHVANLHLIGLAADDSRDSGAWVEVSDIESL